VLGRFAPGTCRADGPGPLIGDDGQQYMNTLLRFGDTQGLQCWSQVKTSIGETIWIGIAQTGILIKLSKWGLFGKKLFEETNPFKAGEIARRLSSYIDDAPIPEGMSNIVLISLTANALQCSTSNEFVARLKAVQQQIA
jgi:hypothetical protein